MAWEELAAILDERRDELRRERQRIPTACPNDGEPLQEAPGGVLHCPYDGWQWPRDREDLLA